MHVKLRFDFGSSTLWAPREEDGNGIVASAGPDLVTLRGPVATFGRGLSTVARFEVEAGQSIKAVRRTMPSPFCHRFNFLM